MLDGGHIPYADMTPCLSPLSPAERFPADGRNHSRPPACGAPRPARQRPGAALGGVSPGGAGEPAVTTNILGISAFYHDSAACLVRDGEIIAAAQEERFTRKKHDPGFPIHAVRYCLREGRVALGDLRYVAFYDKPLVKLERLLETYLSFAPSGIRSFVTAMPVWSREDVPEALLQKEAGLTDGGKGRRFPRCSSASTTNPRRGGVLSLAVHHRGGCCMDGSVSGPRRRPGSATATS